MAINIDNYLSVEHEQKFYILEEYAHEHSPHYFISNETGIGKPVSAKVLFDALDRLFNEIISQQTSQ